MATDHINSIKQDEEIKPLFKSFQWHRKELEDIQVAGGAYADLAGRVRDIASGCATIMELIEYDEIQASGDRKFLMSNGEKGDLVRLAIQSLRMLNDQADEGLDWMYDNLTEKGKAEKLGRINHD